MVWRMDPIVPLVDIAGARRGESDVALHRTIDDALESSGFLLITGHGIDPAVPPRLRALARQFFEQPVSVKSTSIVDRPARGWVPPATMANAKSYGVVTAPDLHESIMFGRERAPEHDPFGVFPLNCWPDAPVGLRDAVESYLDTMYSVAETMMTLLAQALGLAPTYFDPYLVDAVGSLGLHRYPPYTATGPASDEQYRIGPHTDFGALTLLDRQQAVSGLQIQTQSGEWLDAPYVPGALTVNIGDLMARWTGDRWRSTRHRIPAPSAAVPDEEIYSLVFFYDVDPATVVETLPGIAAGPRHYEPVLAGEYIEAKLASIPVG